MNLQICFVNDSGSDKDSDADDSKTETSLDTPLSPMVQNTPVIFRLQVWKNNIIGIRRHIINKIRAPECRNATGSERECGDALQFTSFVSFSCLLNVQQKVKANRRMDSGQSTFTLPSS